MKLDDLLFERSAVIKKDGFAVLQTALNNELPENMDLHGAEACLLMSMSELIRQQTGERVDRLRLVDDLKIPHDDGGSTWYRPMKYHDFASLVHKITTDGVYLFGKNEKAKFNLKMYNVKGPADVKKLIDEGISVIAGWQNTDQMLEAMKAIDKGSRFQKHAAKLASDNFTLEKIKVDKETWLNFLHNRARKFFNTSKAIYDLVRGILPYIKKHDIEDSYHAVLLVGYDEKDKVFIIKDIREKYLLGGMAKIPYQYIDDACNGRGEFIKVIIGIEAEKI